MANEYTALCTTSTTCSRRGQVWGGVPARYLSVTRSSSRRGRSSGGEHWPGGAGSGPRRWHRYRRQDGRRRCCCPRSRAAASRPGTPRCCPERQHRVIPERVLERRRRLLFLAVAHHDGGVQVDHQPRQLRPAALAGGNAAPTAPRVAPTPPPGPPPEPARPRPTGGVEPVQQPPARRVRRHRPEQLGLIGQHRNVGDRGRAIGDRDGQIHQHPPRIMTRSRPAQPGQRLRELARSTSCGPPHRPAAATRHATPHPRHRR